MLRGRVAVHVGAFAFSVSMYVDWIVTGFGQVSSMYAPLGVELLVTQAKRQLDSPMPSFMFCGPIEPDPPGDWEATAWSAMLVQPLQSESVAGVQLGGQQPSPLT